MMSLEQVFVEKGWNEKWLNEGRQEGRLEEKIGAARAMLHDRLPVSQIAQYTGLPVEEIQALQIKP